MARPGPKPKSKLSKADKKICVQYMNGLRRSLNRVTNDPNFEFYSIKIKNKRLAKLLLCICHDRQLLVGDYVEELLISQLRKRDSYRRYFDDEMSCEIQTKSCMRIYNEPRMATQDVRLNPAKGLRE